MRFFLVLFFFLSSLFAKNPYENLIHYQLQNGMHIYLLPDLEAQNTQLVVNVNVGMDAETEATAGVSHLVEHMIFRDTRIKDGDYYSLITEKGATYLNGFTEYKKSNFIATINPESAYWLTETFAQMLLDKNVTQKDLEIEKHALQIEIGEPNWVDHYLPDRFKIIDYIDIWESLFPPQANVFRDSFGIDTTADKLKYQDESLYKYNNKTFSLKEVMAHYHDYYYPGNMTLKIAGKFYTPRMKEVIAKTFGKAPKREGKSTKKPMIKDALLDHKPFIRYKGGMEESPQVTLGVKLLINDPKKKVVIETYIEDLANRLGKIFRSQSGEAYSPSGYLQTEHNAGIAMLQFSTPHAVYEKNIEVAKSIMFKEGSGDINNSVIIQALKKHKNQYNAMEHDTASLMQMIDTYEAFEQFYGTSVQNPYTLFASITPSYYKKVLNETFRPEHLYAVLKKDYLLFPYEGMVLSLSLLLFYVIFVYKLFHAKINKRKVIFYRRLSNPILSMLIILCAVMIAIMIANWLVYLIVQITPINDMWAEGYEIPMSYLIMIADTAILTGVTYLVVKKLFKWFYFKLFITHHTMTLVGAKSRYIDTDLIESYEIVPWSLALWGKIYGVSLFFYRPLLKVNLGHNRAIYLRQYHARHLHEDIELIVKPKHFIEKKRKTKEI